MPAAARCKVAILVREFEQQVEGHVRLEVLEAPRYRAAQGHGRRAAAHARAATSGREAPLERLHPTGLELRQETPAPPVSVDVARIRATSPRDRAVLGSGPRPAGMHGLRHREAALDADDQRGIRRVSPLIEHTPIDADTQVLDAAPIGRGERQTEERLPRCAVERGRRSSRDSSVALLDRMMGRRRIRAKIWNSPTSARTLRRLVFSEKDAASPR